MADMVSYLGYVAGVFWGMFGDLLDFIVGNPLILYPVIFAIMAGLTLSVIAFVKSFGVGGKRRRRRRSR